MSFHIYITWNFISIIGRRQKHVDVGEVVKEYLPDNGELGRGEGLRWFGILLYKKNEKNYNGLNWEGVALSIKRQAFFFTYPIWKPV